MNNWDPTEVSYNQFKFFTLRWCLASGRSSGGLFNAAKAAELSLAGMSVLACLGLNGRKNRFFKVTIFAYDKIQTIFWKTEKIWA